MNESDRDRETGSESFRFSPRPNRAGEIVWYPWGKEAFSRAVREGKPILLSISAVWCHWCHVMDETTYSDPEIIRMINREYIPIRVDSDRNPDINRRYNQGGWPTTAFLSSRGTLLAGTTYLPPDTMRKVLAKISSLYRENRQELEKTPLRIETPTHGNIGLDASLVESVGSSILAAWDREYGGLGMEPKFPHPDTLSFAFHAYHRGKGKDYLEFAIRSLRAIAEGNLHDRVEGGFFRYSVTRDWSRPHYEKMLDDNARLLSLFLRAFGTTGEESFLSTAAETADYIYRVLSDGERRFFGSQDADEEYYSREPRDRANFPSPHVDTTVYLDSASRAARSFLEAGTVLGRGDYVRLALRFLDFAWEECFHARGGMAHYHDGSPRRRGLVEDQVEAALAFQKAFSHTGNRRYLDAASALIRLIDKEFRDPETGLLLDAAAGFLPSGLHPEPAGLVFVSRTAEAMFAHAFLANDPRLKDSAYFLLSSFSGESASLPQLWSAAPLASTLDVLLEGPLLIKVGGSLTEDVRDFLIMWDLSPNLGCLLIPTSADERAMANGASFFVEVCGMDSCYLKTDRVEEIAVYLGIKPGIIERMRNWPQGPLS